MKPRRPARRPRPARVTISPARLMAEAEKAREHAYAPYSKLKVGAALLTRAGRIVRGCNVENTSFGLSICAERNAGWKAVSEGERDFVAVAVTAGPQSASPCGACRQVLREFSPDLLVFWRGAGGRLEKETIENLLRKPFVWPRGKAR